MDTYRSYSHTMNSSHPVQPASPSEPSQGQQLLDPLGIRIPSTWVYQCNHLSTPHSTVSIPCAHLGAWMLTWAASVRSANASVKFPTK